MRNLSANSTYKCPLKICKHKFSTITKVIIKKSSKSKKISVHLFLRNSVTQDFFTNKELNQKIETNYETN